MTTFPTNHRLNRLVRAQGETVGTIPVPELSTLTRFFFFDVADFALSHIVQTVCV